jgi:hypothetical protein
MPKGSDGYYVSCLSRQVGMEIRVCGAEVRRSGCPILPRTGQLRIEIGMNGEECNEIQR